MAQKLGITNSAWVEKTFKGYAWSGHPQKDLASLWGQNVEDGVFSHSAAGRGPSPLIWNNCPWNVYANGVGGVAYFNDFIDGGYVLAANKTVVHLNRGVCGFTAATAGTTISQLVDEPTGVIALNAATDNEDSGICILGGVNTAGQYVFTSGKKSWFEARIKSLNITNDKFGIFCGFAEEGLCATTALIGADDALTDKDYVGFHKLAADGDKMDTVFNTEGGAAAATAQADAVTLEVDTYVKVGWYCDGTTVTPYGDGVALTTTTVATAEFPDGQELAFYFVAMNKGGDAHEACIDWVRIAREL